MSADSIRSLATYLIALVVIVGGGILLVVPSQVPPEQLLPFLTGVIGTVIGYVFSERSGSRAAEIALTSPPITMTTGEPPVTVTSGTIPPPTDPDV